jgi:mono/diheme cytochrome c family protein
MIYLHSSHIKAKLFSFVFALTLIFSNLLSAQEGDAAKGKELFTANCTACHTLDTKLIGPPLKGIGDKRDFDFMFNQITNPNEWVVKNAEAKKVFEEYNKVPMTPFPQFTKEDVANIIAYTKVGDEGVKAPEKTQTQVAVTPINKEYLELPAKDSFNWWQPLVLLVLAGLVYFTTKKKMNIFAIILTIVLLLATAYFLFNWMLQIGVETGYKPIQPIEFSHKVHAGDNGIDCEYCHSAAKHSKTSGIPSNDVCMNCHKFIGEYKGELYGGYDKAFFDAEIAKVQQATGWDKTKFAYTNKGKGIDWVRVHNLPDFAYYNHAQHVTVAGLECQTCHGPVEQMHRVEQFSQLTMQWCLDCHKVTPVKLDENGYYKGTYEEFAKGHKGATVADMGGRECGKCHY